MKAFFYIFVGFVLAVAFLGDDNDEDRDVSGSHGEKTLSTRTAPNTGKATEATPPTATLSNDPEKAAAFDALPQNVAVSPQAQPELSTEPKLSLPQWLYVSGSTVNVRAGPGVSHAVIGQLPRGTKVLLLQGGANWNRIRLVQGNRSRDGWMSARYLSDRVALPVARKQEAPKRRVATPSLTEITQARKQIIRQSIAGYSGSCPCPYNTDRAGRRCGKRSAWSRPGGYSPLCYESDVSSARVSTYFARQRGAVQ